MVNLLLLFVGVPCIPRLIKLIFPSSLPSHGISIPCPAGPFLPYLLACLPGPLKLLFVHSWIGTIILQQQNVCESIISVRVCSLILSNQWISEYASDNLQHVPTHKISLAV